MLYTDHEAFLTELSRMFEMGRETGKSVWITMKRYDGRTTRNPRKSNDIPRRPKKGAPERDILEPGCDLQPSEYKCMIRAKLGDKKISAAIGGLRSNQTPSKASTKAKPTATSSKTKGGVRNK